jgi:hypothetical protein
MIEATFPFGEPLREVTQQDRSPKRVFVLGVYASAVHARWVGPGDQTRVKALAVASEPEIFWKGDGAAEIISRISVPPEVGRLEPADPTFNGPSGLALDELFLSPLDVDRSEAWLCDLVPHSCVNSRQRKAIDRHYSPLAAANNLPAPTIPRLPKQLTDDARRQAILDELIKSQAPTLILLGDQPLEWFLCHYDQRWQCLKDFGEDPETYGRQHPVTLPGCECQVLPLAHPRQAARLGSSSTKWADLHANWVESATPL